MDGCARHRWRTAFHTDRFRYQQCEACQRRRLLPIRPAVLSAVDREWLAGR